MGRSSRAGRARISLRDSREFLERFPVAVALIRELRHVYVNLRFLELTGYSAIDLQPMPFGTLFDEPSREPFQKISLDWQFGRNAPQRNDGYLTTRSEDRVGVMLFWGRAIIDDTETTILAIIPRSTVKESYGTPISPSTNESRRHAQDVLRSLSPRLRNVLELIARGKSNREIAQALGIGEATVKVHVHRLLQKINAKNRIEAIFFAQRAIGNPQR